jgi:predicted nucleic acid-binding protein
MRFVLDSCVAIKWVLPEPDTPKAVRIRSEFRRGLHELLAPSVYPVEVAHALARAERRGVIPRTVGARRLASVLHTRQALHPHLPLLPRAFAIASHAGIGVYDCLYVALVEHERCSLVTADDRLVRTLQVTVPFVTSLASLP